MTLPFTIRDMERGDREAVIELMLTLNRFENAISGDRATSRKAAVASLADDEEKLRAGGGLRLVAAREGGAAVGYMCCAVAYGPPFLKEEVRTFLYVHSLVVAESARGEGIGAALMAGAEDFARGQGLRAVVVAHLAGNDGAGRLYERLGFSPHMIERQKRLD